MVLSIQLTQHRAANGDLLLQAAISHGEGLVDPSPQHGDGGTVVLQGRPMCRSVDTRRETADDAPAGSSDRRRQFPGYAKTVARSTPGSDDRDARAHGEHLGRP